MPMLTYNLAIRYEKIEKYGHGINISKIIGENVRAYKGPKVKVFLSHKHGDKSLESVIGLLERLGAKVYIDSDDPRMPERTCRETAIQLRGKINECRKFVFLATKESLQSKWCSWEIGYADRKARRNMAIFPVSFGDDREFQGNEYLQLYPCIEERNGEYFVHDPIEQENIPLNEWLNMPSNRREDYEWMNFNK